MRSVFIGRFQPFHRGHLHTVKQILEKDEDLIIVIGSSQYSHTPNNPFSGGERVMMIRAALLEAGLPMDHIDIIPLSDIHIHPLWVSHLKSFGPYFDKAYTHNPLVRRLFTDADVPIDETDLLKRTAYSGNHVRDLIKWENDEWEALLPNAVVEIIKENKLDERIRQIGDTTLKK
jgi:nicotinamide-nucleotide adenylyltransferase